MMKRITTLLLTLIFISCQESAVEPDNTPDLRLLSAEEVQVTKGANEFAFHLFHKLQKGSPENTFISPISISMALAMVLNGAGEETQQSILNTIDYDGYTAGEINTAYMDLTKFLLTLDRKVQMGIANSVWYNQGLTPHPEFSSVVRDFYDGEARSLDFASTESKDVINGWVESKTNNRIKDLIENISTDEVMFIVNAIYFKGDWTWQFDKSKTRKASFTTIDNTLSEVDMMFSKGVTVGRALLPGLQVIDIPYGNGQFNFTVVLPDDPAKLDDIVSTISADQVLAWASQSDSVTVELELPRFKMEWKNDLLKTLEDMGMQKSGFPKLLVDPMPLEIGRVVHQTYLDVSEEGTEAAAATAVGIIRLSAPLQPLRITIDRPFLFMIREKHTGAILFLGQLIDPSKLN
jgi:serine protease inhibitor